MSHSLKNFDAIPGPTDRWWGLSHLFGMRRDYLGYSERLQRGFGDLVGLRPRQHLLRCRH